MIWPKKKQPQQPAMTWEPAANQALEQAINQSPVPGPLKGKVEKELKKAAEDHARLQGHTTVTAEDLMQGMLAKMPAAMKEKVEAAMKKGPEGLKNLQNELK